MRVLMLCSSYPRHAKDSASIFLRHLAQSLSQAGADILVLAPDHKLVDRDSLDSSIRLFHFRYFPRRWQTLAYGSGILPNLRQHPWRWIQIPFFLLSMFIALLRVCRHNKPDIIHAHWILPQGLVAVCVGKLLNIPVISTTHGSDAFALQSKLSSTLKKFTLRHSQAWSANTKTTASKILALGRLSPSYIVPMGVDIKQFNSQKPSSLHKTGISELKYTILFVGRLVSIKGVNDLIEGYANLPDDLLNKTRLWIVGDGIERNKLERLALALNVKNKVHFFGRLSHDELPDYYTAADIFVAPSITEETGETEGQGVVIIEAMASSLPVIACQSGGINDVITHGETGLLVPSQNSQALSSAISSLLKDQSKRHRLSEQGKKHAEQHYTWEVVSNRFLDIYRNLLPKGRS